MRPAKRRSRASIAIPWCKACARTATARCSPWRRRTSCIFWSPAWPSPATMWCVSVPARSPNGPTPCRENWRRQVDNLALMAKICLAVRHVAFEDLGLLGPLVAARDYEVRYHDAGVEPFEAQTLLAADLLVVLGGPIGVYEAD